MENLANDVEVASQDVVVVGLGLFDRLDCSGGNNIGAAPQRLPAVCLRILESNRMNGTAAAAASAFICSTSSGSPF